MECVYDRRTLYPVSHVFTPFLLYVLTHNAFLTVLLFTVWEFVEYFTFESTGSYHVFPGGQETLCDVIVLDLGNGFLGLFLAWFVTWQQKLEPVRLDAKMWTVTILFGAVWSVLSPLDFECDYWLFPCEYTAWGIPLITALLGGYAYYLYRLGYEHVAKVVFGVGALYLNIAWIPFSTPLLIYYASLCILIVVYAN